MVHEITRFRSKLYVAGQSPRSQQAIANLRRIGDQLLGGRYDVEVVDVVADPDAAEQDRILTTPTLIKEAPLPARRVTGDLSDSEKVLYGLALRADLPSTPDERSP